MLEPDLFNIFLHPLNKAGMTYMVTGAVAVIIYGEIRVTHDIDIILELKREDIEKISTIYPSEHFYYPPLETLRIEAGRSSRGHFNIIHHETGFKADIYLSGKDELHQWAISKKRKIELEGEGVWIAPPEYVILRKLEYYREGGSDKHLRDIAGMIEVSKELIDFTDLENRITQMGLQKEWEEAKNYE